MIMLPGVRKADVLINQRLFLIYVAIMYSRYNPMHLNLSLNHIHKHYEIRKLGIELVKNLST